MLPPGFLCLQFYKIKDSSPKDQQFSVKEHILKLKEHIKEHILYSEITSEMLRIDFKFEDVANVENFQ